MPDVQRWDRHPGEDGVDDIRLVRSRPYGTTLVPGRNIQLVTLMGVEQLLHDQRLIIHSLQDGFPLMTDAIEATRTTRLLENLHLGVPAGKQYPAAHTNGC